MHAFLFHIKIKFSKLFLSAEKWPKASVMIILDTELECKNFCRICTMSSALHQ